MRSDRYADETVNTDINEIYASPDDLAQIDEPTDVENDIETKKRFGREKKRKSSSEENSEGLNLYKMKKKDLLEIMLEQSKEIDALRAKVADLEGQLANREFEFSKIGSIAEASLAVTNIFKDAEDAARIYLENIRRSYERRSKQHSND